MPSHELFAHQSAEYHDSVLPPGLPRIAIEAAHPMSYGFAGTGAALTANPVAIRRHLIQNGYAWAASSYSKNYYDVRVF